jgi:phosphatidyl-myo-inositol dimannoside synthase
MSVLLVTQDFPPDQGGIQTYCWELAQRLCAEGTPVRVLCPTPERRNGSPPAPPAPRGLPLAIDRIDLHGSFLFAPLLGRMRRYLAAHPDIRTIVSAQWQVAVWQLAAPALAARYRRLCLVHGRELLTTVFGPLTRPLAARTLASMDEVLPVSAPVRRLLEDVLPARAGGPVVRVVPPGVDPALFRPVEAGDLRRRLGLGDARVVLSISRLARRKNVDGLVRAFVHVRAACPGSVLVIGGDGPERPRLEADVRRLGLGEAVRFLGRIPDDELVAHYNLADVFVLPGRERPGDVEGFGITLLEAGACERPVVAGRTGGMVDAVADGETGLLVEPGDDHALARALIALLGAPDRARALGRAARVRIVRELTWARCAERVRQGFAPLASPG